MRQIVVGIHEAKTHFSKLIRSVQAGDEVVVKSFDKPVAKLVPYAPPTTRREPGLLADKVAIKTEFDELPPGFELFER